MNDVTERWLPVVRYEGLYEVSDWGRVRSLPRNTTRGKILKPGLVNGYPHVILCQDGHRHGFFVHTLVLEAFVGLCPAGQECRHGPGGKQDARLINLCWGTREENYADRFRDGTDNTGERNGRARLTADDVREIRALVASGKSQAGVGRIYGMTRYAIWDIVHGRRWAHVT
jgi:DNA-binding transcriptional LysR family regulator